MPAPAPLSLTSLHLCPLSVSYSLNVPSSKSKFILSLAVSLPLECWAEMRCSPPPRREAARESLRRSRNSRLRGRGGEGRGGLELRGVSNNVRRNAQTSLCCCHFTHFQALALLGSSAIVDIVRDSAIARLLASLVRVLITWFEERIERREVERKAMLNIFNAVRSER